MIKTFENFDSREEFISIQEIWTKANKEYANKEYAQKCLEDLYRKLVGRKIEYKINDKIIKIDKVKKVFIKIVIKDISKHQTSYSFYAVDQNDSEHNLIVNDKIKIITIFTKEDPYGEENWDD